MTQSSGFIDDFGMDTITLSGSLPDKLRAMRDAGFSQVMLKASDLVAHPEGVDDAVRAVSQSGLRVTGFQVLRDFEGLSGHLHDYKVDIAKSMLEMAQAVGAPLLLACSSTSTHATQDLDALARDLRKLAMLAVPLKLRIAYEGLSWGRTINEFTTAWEVVCRADAPNLGLAIDSFHILAAKTPLAEVETLDPDKIFLVQLADFMWQEARSFEERIATARHFRVFPGEGVHSAQVAELVLRLEPDLIKLDKSITRNIDKRVRHQSLAAALLTFADGTSASIVAEGIETEAELATLKKLGVPYGQGYYLGRPEPLIARALR